VSVLMFVCESISASECDRVFVCIRVRVCVHVCQCVYWYWCLCIFEINFVINIKTMHTCQVYHERPSEEVSVLVVLTHFVIDTR